MTLTRGALRQLQELVRPLGLRVANSIARAVVQRTDDGKKLQMLQIGVLQGEALDDCERFQEYGLSSVPIAAAEAVVIFPNGDRGHPLVVAVDDRRYRPTGLNPGEVAVYNHTGARILMTADGDIEVTPAPGREVFIRSEGGSADRLVKKSEYDGHTHPPGTFAAGGDLVTGDSGGAAAVDGTATLQVE